MKKSIIISYERIRDEFNKMMECEKPSIAIKRLDGCGILQDIFPEIYASFLFLQISEINDLSIFNVLIGILVK